MNTSLLILAAGMSSRMKASSSKQIEYKKLHQANTRSKGLIEIGDGFKTVDLLFVVQCPTSRL